MIQTRTGRKIRIGRLVRLHADDMEDIASATAGDIVGLFGIDCHTGDTFVSGGRRLAMTSMHVPDAGDLPVDHARPTPRPRST